MRKLNSHVVTVLTALLITLAGFTSALGAPSRAVDTACSPWETDCAPDLNEELDEIFEHLPQVLDNVSGTNSITASIAEMPPLAEYASGNIFRAKIVNTTTLSTVTLDIDGVGAADVKDISGASLPVGALVAGSVYTFQYIGSPDNQFRVTSPLGTGVQTDALCFALSDEATVITSGTAKVTFRMPYTFVVTAVYAEVNTSSSSGLPTFDINEAGLSILGTKITIDVGEEDSNTAGAAATITDSSLAFRAKMTFDIDVAGTGAKGAKVCMVGTH